MRSGALLLFFAFMTAAAGEEPAHTVTLPGLRVALPRWKELEHVGDFSFGRVSLQAPDKPYRGLSLIWSRGEPMSRDYLLGTFATFLGGSHDAAPSRPIAVAGHRGESFFVHGQPPALVTHWYCPVDKREIDLLVMGELDEAGLSRLAAGTLKTVACHTVRAESRPLPLYPPFNPPTGFRPRTDLGGTAHMFSDGPGNRIYIIQPAMVGQGKIAGMIADNANVRDAVAGKLLGMEQVRVEPRPLVSGERPVWKVGATLDGAPMHLVMTAWQCGADSFVAHFVGPVDDLDEAAQVLARIPCPGRAK